jgi:hypothetical protein
MLKGNKANGKTGVGEFYQLSRTRYGRERIVCERDRKPVLVDEVVFIASNCKAECKIAWYDLGLDRPSPKLEMYSDSWEHLAKHPTLFAKLAQRPGIQSEEFCQLLREHGFQDVTTGGVA